jgi:integrase
VRAGSCGKLASHLKAVRGVFGSRRAITLTTVQLETQAKTWTDEGRAPAAVCRRLESLRGAFNYAANQKPPCFPRHEVPHFEMPKVQNARQGFVPRADFLAPQSALGNEDEDVRDYVEWFWWTGMRPNEIRQLSWTMLDKDGTRWTMNLDPKAARSARVAP